MNFKQSEKDVQERNPMVVEKPPEVVPEIVENHPQVPPAQPTQGTQDDLFSAHDFDFKINLDVPLPVTSVNVTPKTVAKDLALRRCSNIQDYKKKRGFI